jgi:hypothetical protein
MMEFYAPPFVCGEESSTQTLDDIYTGVRWALSKLSNQAYMKEWLHFQVDEYASFL